MKILPNKYYPKIGTKFIAYFGENWRGGKPKLCKLIGIANGTSDEDYYEFSIKGERNFYLGKHKEITEYIKDGDLTLVK